MSEKDNTNRLIKKFIPVFFAVALLCLSQRFLALLSYYRDTFVPLYMPLDKLDGMKILLSSFGSSLLRGICFDIIFSFLLAALMCLPIIGRRVHILTIAVLAIYFSINVEHIKYNFAHIDLTTAHNAMSATFIKGQTTAELLLRVAILLTAGISAYFLLSVRPFRRVGLILVPPILIVSIIIIPSFSFLHPPWVQSHPLLPNEISGSPEPDFRKFPASAFKKTPAITMEAAENNILILYLEGLSFRSLDLGGMKNLRKLADDNISFERYAANQLITANGLYTTLTGDFPYFVSGKLKWLEVKPGSKIAHNALPFKFSEAGYHTAFLQSAPLDFMSKGDILPRIGFSESLGGSTLSTGYSSNAWGIDDKALFEHTLDYLDSIPPNKRWFVSVLTTGTHSPYNVPDDFMTTEPSSRRRALAYLDAAIGDLLDGLSNRGLLKNTVVIITSDESRELPYLSRLQDQVMLNWLPLIILHPSGIKEKHKFFIGSHRFPDIVGSITSELQPNTLEGLYKSQDPLILGNTINNRLFWFEPYNEMLLSCDTQTFNCARFEGIADPMTADVVLPVDVSHFVGLEQLISELEPEN